MKHILFSILLVIFTSTAIGQRLKRSERAIVSQLEKSIQYLSDDKLEGRRTGTEGEKLAAQYIAEQFKKIGLLPRGDDNSYLQKFEVNEGKQILSDTHFKINEQTLKTGTDFFPFIFSANKSINGFASPAIKETGVPWYLDIKEIVVENANNPHFDLHTAIKNKAKESADLGATALIVYNSGNSVELKFEGKSKIPALNIPVVFLSNEMSAKFLSEKTADLNLDLQVAIGDKKRTGQNVIGFIDNNAASTVVIGAHYDHLGYGEDHNSLWTGTKSIHNGADDNASGVAAVIELARLLNDSKLDNSNYLFIGFSGEELGLYGSKYFTAHPTIPIDKIDFMINCDMVGRLNTNTHALTIGGYGTSPAWGTVLPEKTKTLQVNFDSSGIGPSDHTSFYLKNVPVLFFFTGTHTDYHKPSDDAEKINYKGTLRIVEYIYDIIKETDDLEKLAFSKTRDTQVDAPRFTVSLGIMPNYTFSKPGVQADGIIDGKIAAKAGIKAGDVIVKIGEHVITDLNAYMAALSKFKKGDPAKVVVKRGEEEINFDITF